MTSGEFARCNTKFLDRDLHFFPKTDEACWLCEERGTDEQPVRHFMGRDCHVRCLQVHTNRGSVGESLK